MSRFSLLFIKLALLIAGAIAAVVVAGATQVSAQSAASPPQESKAVQAPTKNEDGKYLDADGTPTYSVKADGTVDWYTFSGFRRYHAECHTCHGPDGEGSSYAPALAKSLKTMSHEDFMETVVNGRKNVNSSHQQVMPAFGENVNVMCYLDDIYVYLKARADGALARGRPEKREDKPQAATKNEDTCFGRG